MNMTVDELFANIEKALYDADIKAPDVLVVMAIIREQFAAWRASFLKDFADAIDPIILDTWKSGSPALTVPISGPFILDSGLSFRPISDGRMTIGM